MPNNPGFPATREAEAKSDEQKKLDAQAEALALKESEEKDDKKAAPKKAAPKKAAPKKAAPKKAAAKPADTITLDTELAAAVLVAATNGTGYYNTTGSAHATKVNEGIVRVEMDVEGKRKTVTVKVPTSLQMTVIPDTE